MKRTTARLWLCAGLLTLNLVFIWGNSLLPAEYSRAFSLWVRDLLAGLTGTAGEAATGHGLLRKIAHFTEFCALGVWLCWLGGMLQKSRWLSLLGGFAAACADETLQCFVPDRGPGLRDVLIDTVGVAVGILLLLTLHRLCKKGKAPLA